MRILSYRAYGLPWQLALLKLRFTNPPVNDFWRRVMHQPPSIDSAGRPSSEVLRFGDFQLLTSPLSLIQPDGSILLQPQPTRLLALLIRRRGQIVTREEIRQELWPSDAFLDHEQAINFAIRKIRMSLEDQAESPRFIETVPRVGYRFVASVEELLVESVPAAGALPVGEEADREGETAAAPRRPELPSPAPNVETSQPPQSLPQSPPQSLPQSPARSLPRPSGWWPPAAGLRLLTLAVLLLLLVPIGVGHEIYKQSFAQSSALDHRQTSQAAVPKHPKKVDDEYLQGRFLVEQNTREEVDLGISKLRHVIAGDPDFAPAHFALALGFFRLGSGSHHFNSFMPEVQEKVERALELDSNLPEANWLLSAVLFYYRHDWEGAESAARRAIALDEALLEARQQLAVIMAARGLTSEAVEIVRQAVAIDPAELLVRSDLAFCLMYERRYSEALDGTKTNLEVAPHDFVNLFLDASLRYHLGDREASLKSFQTYFEAWGEEPPASLDETFERLFAMFQKRRQEGRRAHFSLALLHALRGEPEVALDMLVEACDRDLDWELPMVGVDPRFDAVRELPGFAQLASCLPTIS